MAGLRFFGVHHLWEDWAGMLLGVLIGISPWIVGVPVSEAVILNTTIVGALVLVLAMMHLGALQRWEEGIEIICGLWLIVSAFSFGYGGTLRTLHVVLGALVALVAALELYQDWDRSDDELAQHGH